MKPKDLPFTIKKFSTREPSFQDNILTIPSYYFTHKKENFPEFKKKIDQFQKIHVEICSGNGEWIADRAFKNPHILYIAVEKKFMRVRKIWSKMKNRELLNMLIVSGMGEDLFNYYLQETVIDEIFINFPDPWPKARHAKHRIIKNCFLAPIYKALKASGSITITTDSEEYSAEIIKIFKDSPFFESEYSGGYTKLCEKYGGSYFKRLWADLGRENKLMKFKKMESCSCELQKI